VGIFLLNDLSPLGIRQNEQHHQIGDKLYMQHQFFKPLIRCVYAGAQNSISGYFGIKFENK
jgi:hypothetical protein